jgi:hypothetical protein
MLHYEDWQIIIPKQDNFCHMFVCHLDNFINIEILTKIQFCQAYTKLKHMDKDS